LPLEKVLVNPHRLDAAPPPPVAEHDVEAASGKNFKKLQRLMAERLMEGERPDRFCLLDPVPTGSGPFFYRPGVKQRRAKTTAQAALLIGYWLRQPLHVITFICEGGPEHPKASGSSRPSEYCTRPC
jgi:hypothetical protein